MKTTNYIELYHSGQLQQRIEEALAILENCRLCPQECNVNRLKDERRVCQVGRYARVASYGPHLGEEDCLRGWRGSGTIFFGGCNLRCVFCQNFDISQRETGIPVSPQQLAGMMIELQERGCHNINWVTPGHVVPQILESLPFAIEGGLHIPIVYNTNAFDTRSTLKWLDGIVDIYMPDFKYWYQDPAKIYLKTNQYPEIAQIAIKEMHRQVGDLVIDEQGLARRGVLIRHLIMPNGLDDTREIMNFLVNELSTQTYVNLMAQFHPSGKVCQQKYGDINRRITHQELQKAYEVARAAGLHRFDER